MDVNFINPVLSSTLNVLSTMAHIEPKVGSPKIKEINEYVQGKNTTGVQIPAGVRAVVVQARDKQHGYGGKTVQIPLPGR